MTPRRFLALAATLALLVAPALADGRADWSGYAWQKIDVADCVAAAGGGRTCPLYNEKWDWKRNQWVSIRVSLLEDRLQLTQRLQDQDFYDDDDVCVTAVVVDADGRNLAVHHTNWYMKHGQVREEAFEYPAPGLGGASAIHIGSKQCREGSRQDDAVFAAVKSRLSGPTR